MLRALFVLGYGAIALLFATCAAALILFAGSELWQTVAPGARLAGEARFQAVIECIGILTIAVASLELSQTILEEEIQREAHLNAPTRVRRFLSRFMVVVIVSLAIECLVIIFREGHERPSHLPHAAAVGLAAAVLLAAWGVFVHLNRSVEELEPEAMARVKEEDAQMQ